MSSPRRVVWGCHGVITWLTQTNTSVGQCYFQVLNNYNYMYYVFFNIHIYMYILYTKNTSGLSRCLGQVTSKEGFQASSKDFKTVLSPQTIFYTLMFIRYLYTNVLYMHVRFSYFIMFSTSRYSKIETFIVYFIRSLSMLYTHSSYFLPFQVKVLLGDAIASYSLVLWWNS